MPGLPKFSDVKDAIQKGLDNINKLYHKVNDTDTFFICLGTVIFSAGLYLSSLLQLQTIVTIFLILFCLPMSFHYF